MKQVVETANAPAAIGPYSQAIKAGGFLFISGQIPIEPSTGQIDAVDIGTQTKRVMMNIQAILTEVGLGFEDVVKTTVFITNLTDFTRINDIYGQFMKESPAARSTVQVGALPKGAKVEIEAIALLK